MRTTSKLANQKATSIGGTPISADASVTSLGIAEALRISTEHSLDVDHLIRLDNSIALPAVPFNIVIDGVTYSAKAGVRGSGAVMSQMFAKKA